jgi:hypothetical protein
MEAARPVARPLMNSSLRAEAGPSGITPNLSQKEQAKVADLEKLNKKRKFAAQQLASLRPEDRLPEEDYQKMAEQLGVFLKIFYFLGSSSVVVESRRPPDSSGLKPSLTQRLHLRLALLALLVRSFCLFVLFTSYTSQLTCAVTTNNLE